MVSVRKNYIDIGLFRKMKKKLQVFSKTNFPKNLKKRYFFIKRTICWITIFKNDSFFSAITILLNQRFLKMNDFSERSVKKNEENRRKMNDNFRPNEIIFFNDQRNRTK